jgi:hypothetical protein
MILLLWAICLYWELRSAFRWYTVDLRCIIVTKQTRFNNESFGIVHDAPHSDSGANFDLSSATCSSHSAPLASFLK